ncbi:hypothetical protein BCR35DRAFT_302014 [Leucosporidium creatinivorum]|uniref:Uncharacterized protein n=1 Tax=Leucosporidium creatinivorum TaxID=106004 RepID=A0A1Y2FX38_9BASI|nr:hypothetical protein BCR35DRAFT_302014 [Leucosporidium creatinivorum]
MLEERRWLGGGAAKGGKGRGKRELTFCDRRRGRRVLGGGSRVDSGDFAVDASERGGAEGAGLGPNVEDLSDLLLVFLLTILPAIDHQLAQDGL